MTHVSSFNQSFNPLDKARRHPRMKKGRPLVAGAGEVIANGKLKVVLTTVDGDTVTYVAIPTMSWRFEPDTSVGKRKPTTIAEEAEALAEAALQSLLPATPADRIKRALDAAIDVIVTLEERARAASPATSPSIAAE